MLPVKNIFPALMLLSAVNSFPQEVKSRIVVAVSWSTKVERMKFYWIFDTGIDSINDADYNTAATSFKRIVPPRFAQELLVCCEKKDLNGNQGSYVKYFNDSVVSEYKKNFDLLYTARDELLLKRAKAFSYKKIYSNFKCVFEIYSIVAEVCECKSAYNNMATNFSDLTVNLRKILAYNKIQKKQRSHYVQIIDSLFDLPEYREFVPAKMNEQ
jgi:hypothetical protein